MQLQHNLLDDIKLWDEHNKFHARNELQNLTTDQFFIAACPETGNMWYDILPDVIYKLKNTVFEHRHGLKKLKEYIEKNSKLIKRIVPIISVDLNLLKFEVVQVISPSTLLRSTIQLRGHLKLIDTESILPIDADVDTKYKHFTDVSVPVEHFLKGLSLNISLSNKMVSISQMQSNSSMVTGITIIGDKVTASVAPTTIFYQYHEWKVSGHFGFSLTGEIEHNNDTQSGDVVSGSFAKLFQLSDVPADLLMSLMLEQKFIGSIIYQDSFSGNSGSGQSSAEGIAPSMDEPSTMMLMS